MDTNQDIARSHLQGCRRKILTNLETKSLYLCFTEFWFVRFFPCAVFLGKRKSREEDDCESCSGDGCCCFRQQVDPSSENNTIVIRPKPTGISVSPTRKLSGTFQRSAFGSLNRSTKTARAFIAKL